MWTALFIRFLRRLIRKGHLVVSAGDSGEISFGDGDGPKVTVRIKDQSTARGLMRDPELALGEAYMDGALSIEGVHKRGQLCMDRLFDQLARAIPQDVSEWVR